MGPDISARRVSLSLGNPCSFPLTVGTDCSVKTKVQQRALAGVPARGVWDTLRRLVRGTTEPFLFIYLFILGC